MNKIKAAVLAHYTFVVPAQAGTQEALLDTRPGLIPAGAGSNARVWRFSGITPLSVTAFC